MPHVLEYNIENIDIDMRDAIEALNDADMIDIATMLAHSFTPSEIQSVNNKATLKLILETKVKLAGILGDDRYEGVENLSDRDYELLSRLDSSSDATYEAIAKSMGFTGKNLRFIIRRKMDNYSKPSKDIFKERPLNQSQYWKAVTFIDKANWIHSYKYQYTNYVDMSSNVTLYCPKHDVEVEVNANQHLFEPSPHRDRRGVLRTGADWCKCPCCIDEEREDGLSRISTPNYLYVIIAKHRGEKFVKIGHTRFSVDTRYSFHNAADEIEVVETLHFEEFGNRKLARKAEKALHDKYASQRYIPQNKFGGYTECFNLTIAKDFGGVQGGFTEE